VTLFEFSAAQEGEDPLFLSCSREITLISTSSQQVPLNERGRSCGPDPAAGTSTIYRLSAIGYRLSALCASD
jgi:hypothetical protein